MNFFILSFALLAAFGSAVCDSSHEQFMHDLQVYIGEKQELEHIKEKVEQICEGYGDKFEAALVKLQQCANDIDDDKETMCSGIKNHFERCAKPVTSLFEECLPEQSTDIPAFLVKATVATSNHLCSMDGEHLFELSNVCARSSNYRTSRCIRRIQAKLEQYRTKAPSKDDICEALNSFKGCFQSHLDYSCGNDKTKAAFIGVYNALLSTCNGGSAISNEVEAMEPNAEWTVKAY